MIHLMHNILCVTSLHIQNMVIFTFQGSICVKGLMTQLFGMVMCTRYNTVIIFINDLWQFVGFLLSTKSFLFQLKWPPQYYWNIDESCVNHMYIHTFIHVCLISLLRSWFTQLRLSPIMFVNATLKSMILVSWLFL